MVLTFLVFGEGHDKYPASGADGVKIAVLRKGRAILKFIQAAAHRKRCRAEQSSAHLAG